MQKLNFEKKDIKSLKRIIIAKKDTLAYQATRKN
jgi:hypothetical protein